MEKSWIVYIALWVVLQIVYYTSGMFKLSRLIFHSILSLVLIYGLYKVFNRPPPVSRVRESKHMKILSKGYKIINCVAGGFFLLFVLVLIFQKSLSESTSTYLALAFTLGFVLSLAASGLYSLREENPRLFRIFSSILLVLILIFPFAFVKQLPGRVSLFCFFAVMFYVLGLCFYGGFKMVVSTPMLFFEIHAKKLKFEAQAKQPKKSKEKKI